MLNKMYQLSNPIIKLGPKAFDLDAIDLLEKNKQLVFQKIRKVLSDKK